MQLETKRLIIKPLAKTDAIELFAYRSNAEVNKYQGFIPCNLQEVVSFIEKLPGKFNVSGSWYQLILFEKNSSNVIGDVGIHFFSKKMDSVELGITISADFQGKGFAQESLNAVIEELYSKYGKREFTASIDPRNIASKLMLEKLNFTEQSFTKKAFELRGEWVDDLVYHLHK